MTVIQAQQFIYHTSDNYQQYHAFATQRISFKAGIMHVGMVFILILIGEYLKPKGTIYLDGQGVGGYIFNHANILDLCCKNEALCTV